MSAQLTELQQKFLSKLFGTAKGDLKIAAQEVGVADYNMLLTDELIEAIKSRADKELALSVPKAIHTISNILANPETTMFMDKIHKVATDILDRAGLSKQERPVVGGTQIGLVFLPNKTPLPVPPSEDATNGDLNGIQT